MGFLNWDAYYMTHKPATTEQQRRQDAYAAGFRAAYNNETGQTIELPTQAPEGILLAYLMFAIVGYAFGIGLGWWIWT